MNVTGNNVALRGEVPMTNLAQRLPARPGQSPTSRRGQRHDAASITSAYSAGRSLRRYSPQTGNSISISINGSNFDGQPGFDSTWRTGQLSQ